MGVYCRDRAWKSLAVDIRSRVCACVPDSGRFAVINSSASLQFRYSMKLQDVLSAVLSAVLRPRDISSVFVLLGVVTLCRSLFFIPV